jgi:hypothetical protein
MLLLPLSGGRFTDEVTDIFTTALPLRFAACRHLVGHAGEQAISAPVTATQALFCRTCAVARGDPCLGTSTVRVSKAGFEPAFSSGRSIRHLHHQRRLSRTAHECATGKPEFFCDARCAAILRTPRSPLCHRCPAHRLVPSDRPRALGHARLRASPGIRVSRSGFRREIVSIGRAARPDNKKPSGARGSGGFASERTGRSPLNEIASTSQARAIDRRKAER